MTMVERGYSKDNLHATWAVCTITKKIFRRRELSKHMHLDNSIISGSSCQKEKRKMQKEILKAGKITIRKQGGLQMRAKDASGEVHYLYGQTEEKIEARFAELKEELQSGIVPNAIVPLQINKPMRNVPTFIMWKYMHTWLKTYKAPPNVRVSTYNRLCYTYKNVIKDGLANEDIRDISATDIQLYLNRLYAMADVGSSVKKKRYHLINACLTQAVLCGDIPSNPCACVKFRNQPTRNEEQVKVFTPSEQKLLVAGLTEERKGRPRYRMGWAFVLILETGMRIGEAMALEWDDIIRTPRGTFLNINKNLSRDGCRPLLEPSPKTEAGKRKIPLNALAMEAITQLRAVAVTGCPYIMGSKTGGYLSYRNMLTIFHNVCRDAGVPVLGIHSLRHTFATNCYNRKVDVKTLSKLLGHANTAITQDIYIHLFEEQFVDAMLRAVGM